MPLKGGHNEQKGRTMNRRKKIWSIVSVGAVLLTYGIVAASAATSNNGSLSPLTLSTDTASPSAAASIPALVPLAGVLGSNQAALTSDDESGIETESSEDSSTSTNSASSDDGDEDSSTITNSTSSDDGDEDSNTVSAPLTLGNDGGQSSATASDSSASDNGND